MDTDKSAFLGTKEIKPLLLQLSLPAFIGMGSNALYNLVDTVFVGRGIGAIGIAALSIAFPMQMLIGAFALTFGVGGAALMSIRLGQGRTEEAKRIAGNSYIYAELVAILFLAVTYRFMAPILQLLGASQTIAPLSRQYLSIIMVGALPLSFSMVTNNQLRAQGDAKAAMGTMLLGTFVNIALDPLFIFTFRMGIEGAAMATVVSQFCSAALALFFLVRAKRSLKLDGRAFIPTVDHLSRITALGMATFIRQLGISIVALVVNLSLARYSGDMAIAAYGMINRLLTFFTMPIMGVAQGLQPLVGYNYGAGNRKRLEEGISLSMKVALVLCIVAMICCIAFPSFMLHLFTDEETLLALGSMASRIIFSAFFCVAFQVIGSTYFQAIGKSREAFVLSMSRQLLSFIPLVLLLPRFLGLNGIWLAFPLSDAFSGLLSLALMLYDMKRQRRSGI